MITIDINNPIGIIVFDAASPRNDFDSGVQRINDDGIPMWRVAAILRQEDARQSDQINVVVPYKVNPAEEIMPFTPVGFKNLRLLTGQGGNGSTWVSFQADDIFVDYEAMKSASSARSSADAANATASNASAGMKQAASAGKAKVD